MLRIVLGIIVGFVVWSVLWVGSDAVIPLLLPNWYGKHQTEFMDACAAGQPFTINPTVLILGHIRSIIISIISGFTAVSIARETAKTTVILGIFLLAFGIFVQASVWNYMPLWYHIPFLLLLIPMTVVGGKLRKA